MHSFKKKYKSKKNTKIKIANISKIFKIIKNAKRPVILSGGGVRYSNAVNEFNNLIKIFNIPVVSSWSGVDTRIPKNKLYYGHKAFMGQELQILLYRTRIASCL